MGDLARLLWITTSPFLDTDIYAVPLLAEKYSIHWVIIKRRGIPLDHQRVIDGITASHDIEIEIVETGPHGRSVETLSIYMKLFRTLSSHQYDCLYTCYSYEPFFMPLIAAMFEKPKTIIGIHNVHIVKGGTDNYVNRAFTMKTIRTFPNLHAFSAGQYALLRDMASSKRVFRVPLALKDYGKPSRSREEERITFLSYGTLAEYKRPDVLIEAAQRAYEKTGRQLKVIFAGNCSDWELYQKRIRYPELFDIRIGRVPNEEVANVFNEADYYVMPYQDIAQSGAMIVAVNYELPIIASDLPALREIVTDEYNGFLVRPADINDLVDRMIYILNCHEEIHSNMIENMRRVKRENFAEDVITEMYVSMFDSIIKPESNCNEKNDSSGSLCEKDFDFDEFERVCANNCCTGCSACINICSAGAIRIVQKPTDSYAAIESANCIGCGLCRRVCPSRNAYDGEMPQKLYAAWTNDNELIRQTASGGIASELYRLQLSEGGLICGVVLDDNLHASFLMTDMENDIPLFHNSKYIFSEMGDIYNLVNLALKQGRETCFIGMPCQVAALNNYLSLKSVSSEKLLTADIVCHGMCNTEFLAQHIAERYDGIIPSGIRVVFRKTGITYAHVYAEYVDHKCVYEAGPESCDAYQVGYHNSIILRESCYNCPYARQERVGDLTLSDFSGLGSVASCDFSWRNVSAVLLNTAKGISWFDRLIESGTIIAEERPLAEQLKSQPRLDHPTPRSREHDAFVSSYTRTGRFDDSVYNAAPKLFKKNAIRARLHITTIERAAAALLPEKLKHRIKRRRYKH